MPNFTTGTTLLADIGELSYNGVVFSTLFYSSLRGRAVKDAAGRTVKYMEWVLTVNGVVTLGPGAATIDNAMILLKELLDAQGGQLVYKGRGFGRLVVNPPGGGGIRDVAWGPVPETFDFTPTGGLSAVVIWSVTFRVFEGGLFGGLKNNTLDKLEGLAFVSPMLQFNEELVVGFNDDGYSTLSIRGTMEMAQTRKTQGDRSVPTAALEANRSALMDQVGKSFDLTRFMMPRRSLNFSRDRRTMEWEFVADEQAPMGLPPWATKARGTFSVRPTGKPSLNIVDWTCALRCSYVIRKDFDRNNAWRAFLALANARWRAHQLGHLPDADKKVLVEQGEGQGAKAARLATFAAVGAQLGPFGATGGAAAAALYNIFFSKKAVYQTIKVPQPARILVNYWGADEGIYEDSKTVSFEVKWQLLTTFSSLLLASGFLRDSGLEGGNIWKKSVQDIVGGRSWLANQVGALEDVIVDFGA